jgi:hypothetical protein
MVKLKYKFHKQLADKQKITKSEICITELTGWNIG